MGMLVKGPVPLELLPLTPLTVCIGTFLILCLHNKQLKISFFTDFYFDGGI